MNTKFFLTLLVIALAVALSGCWNATRSYNEFMAQGQQRNVPLMIYNTSWNDNSGVFNKNRSLAVGLINTGQTRIDSVTLYVAACPNTNTPNTHQVRLTGPFLPGNSYVTQLASAQLNHWVIPWTVRTLVIQAIGVTDTGGKQTIYRNNVAQFLTANISNYCRPLHYRG